MSFVDDIDWDQFLVDTDLGEQNASVSPALSTSTLSASTESDQSVGLDSPQKADAQADLSWTFGFGLAGFGASPTGITHRLENMLSPQTMTTDVSPEIAPGQLFDGNAFGLFSEFDLASQPQPAVAMANDNVDVMAAISQLVSAPPSVEPVYATLPTFEPALGSSNKRKASNVSDEGAPAPKRRGRPLGSSKPKSAALKPPKAISTSPISISSPLLDSDESSPPSVRLTVAGKPSTDRPKSVVPAKFLKDGTAQAVLGMSIEQINAYPTFCALLEDVHPSLLPAAQEFGEKIADNRDKAKDAAKKSRDERRVKIERAEYLEKRCEELEGKVEGMMTLLVALVERGVVGKGDVAKLLA